MKKKQELLIRALKGRAETFYILGELHKAMEDHEGILKVSKKLEIKIGVYLGLNKVYEVLGDYKKAMSFTNKSLNLAIKNRNIYLKVRSLSAKASILESMGDYNSSIEIANKALQPLYRMLRSKVGKGLKIRDIDEEVSDILNTIGRNYNQQGKYDKALNFFSRSLKIVRRVDNKEGIITLLNNIGLIYWHRNDLLNAKRHFIKSLELSTKIGYKNAIAVILGNLGMIYKELNDLNSALKYYYKALEIDRQLSSKTSIAVVLNNIGLLFESEYLFKKAVKNYRESLEIFQEIGDPFGIAMTLNNLAVTYCNLCEYDKAMYYERESEKLAIKSNINEIIIRCYNNKGDIYRETGYYKDSARIFKKALELAEKFNMQILKIDSIIGYVKAIIVLRENNPSESIHEISEYIEFLQDFYSNRLLNEEDKCSILIIFIRLFILEKRYNDALQKLSEALKMIRKIRNKKVVSGIIFLQAKINYLTGRKYLSQLRRAEKLAGIIKFSNLLQKIKKFKKLESNEK